MNTHLTSLTVVFLICILFLFPGCDGTFSGLPVGLFGVSQNGTSGGGSETSETGLTVNLTWEAPLTNADGTFLSDLAGYVVYYGPSPGNYTGAIDVGNRLMVTLGNMPPGDLYISVTAYDLSGNQSDFSQEVHTYL